MTDSLSFDRIADKFDATRSYPDETWNRIIEAIAGALDREKRILEAGVGTGRFAGPLQSMGFDIVGVDISARMLEKAREKKVGNLLEADLCALPFKDHMFSQAVSVHVLHLIKRWKCALGEIARVTTDKFVSVGFMKERSPAEKIRDMYDEACKQLGFPVHHPGVHERELPELLTPDHEKLIATLERPVDVQKLIEDYESRTYSLQWSVPDDIHAQAIQAMRDACEGVELVLGKERIVLLAWDMKRMRKLSEGEEPYRT
jgi:ubiquinone/menaquinone biosynthesis C-methylase UbiE